MFIADLRRRLTSPRLGRPGPRVVGAKVESGSTFGWMRPSPGDARFVSMLGIDRRRLADVLMAAAILVWWLAETFTEPLHPRWLSAASAVAASIALLGRR